MVCFMCITCLEPYGFETAFSCCNGAMISDMHGQFRAFLQDDGDQFNDESELLLVLVDCYEHNKHLEASS